MNIAFILLSKVGAGGGIIGIILTFAIIYYLYRKEHPIYHNVSDEAAGKVFDAYTKLTESNWNEIEYSGPLRMTLNTLLILTGIGLFIFLIWRLAWTDMGVIGITIIGILAIAAYYFVFAVWKHHYYRIINRLHLHTAIIINALLIVATIAIWILAICYTINFDPLAEYRVLL